MRGPKKNVRGPKFAARGPAHPLAGRKVEPAEISHPLTGKAKGFAHLQAGRSAKPAAPATDAQDLEHESQDAAQGEPKRASKSGPKERPKDGEGRPYITLAQLLKMARLVESGGEAKHRARRGDITVNGEAEARPGRKLHAGDTVVVDGDELIVDLG